MQIISRTSEKFKKMDVRIGALRVAPSYVFISCENPLAKDNHNSFSSMTVIIILTGINLTYCSFAFISLGTLKFLSMWNNVTRRICGVQNEKRRERKWERTEYDAHKFDLFFPISFILSLFFSTCMCVCLCDIHRFHIRIIWKCCSNSYIKRHIPSSGGTTRAEKKKCQWIRWSRSIFCVLFWPLCFVFGSTTPFINIHLDRQK